MIDIEDLINILIDKNYLFNFHYNYKVTIHKNIYYHNLKISNKILLFKLEFHSHK